MSMRRASSMLGVSAGQVARWRNGAALTDAMARRVALSIVLRELGMVGVFGRIDTRGAHASAMDSGDGDVIVRVMTNNNDERGGA
ncbi:MAG: hypothetical protein KA154_15595 [Gemmatimonadaceae bacterium]|nr:hypothetical protein [Gemmatimonadaceae bacterium]